MRCKVNLYVAGKTFYECMEATDYQHAKQIALARNPGATVIGCNADFQSDNNSGQSYSSSSSNVSHSVGTNNSSEGSAGGLGGLIILALIGMGLFGLFGDNETPKKNNSFNADIPQVESTYRQKPDELPELPVEVKPAENIFFTNSGIQEEAIDDLGQDWDN
tara:strand:- start:2188 stop:2673 length:486 start_codon:yes stop_codon:yes gene_type:complete